MATIDWTQLAVAAGTGAALGGIIGYLTNKLAVWMLFHPKTPVRIGGKRLPMTPGLVVKNQEGLADSIGRAVATELLDPETVLAHLKEANLEEAIRDAFQRERPRLADREETFAELFVPGHREHLEEFNRRLVAFLCERTANIADRLGAEEGALYRAIRDNLASFLERPVSDYLTPERRAALRNFLQKSLQEELERGGLRRSAENAITGFVEALPDSTALVHGKERLGAYLDELTAPTAEAMQDSLAEFVASDQFGEEVRGRLARKLYQALIDHYPMAAMFLREGTVSDLMAQRWSGIAASLQEVVRGETVRDYLEGELSKGGRALIDSLADQLREEEIQRTVSDWIVGEVNLWLKSEMGSERSGEWIDGLIDRLAERSPAEMLENWEGLLDRLASRAARLSADWLRSETGRGWLEGKITALTNSFFFEQPVKRLVAMVPEEDWNRGSEIVAGVVHQRAIGLLPEILADRLDLERVVSEKVRAFDSDRIEETIQQVSGRELKGIVRLGGVIGIGVGAVWQVIYYLTTI